MTGPKGCLDFDNYFSTYSKLRDRLIELGVPEEDVLVMATRMLKDLADAQ